LNGPFKAQEIYLYPGKNLIGIPFIFPYEIPLDVFRNLLRNGESVSSLQYYEPQTGKWTGCYDFFGKKSGSSTKGMKGSGYLVYIRH